MATVGFEARFDRRDGLVAAAAAVAALAYYFGSSLRDQAAGDVWVLAKWTSVILLAIWAWSRRPAKGAALLALALAVHSVGDVVIAIGPLLGALIAFLCGHLLYFALFLSLGIETPPRVRWRQAVAGLLLLWVFVFVIWLQPQVAEGLGGPVMVYSGVILAMALAATACRAAARWLPVGALLYVASDSVIAIDTFARSLDWASAFTWPTYWVGQLLIASAVLFAPRATPRGDR